VFPLDEEAVLASVRKTSKAILLHEDILSGGVGGEIAARIAEKAFDHLDGPVVRIAAPDTPVPFSPPLEQTFLPSVPKVMEKARWLYNY
jgi:2-oxoisovalerate dehydrogenase E1 component beta subunit